MVIFCPSRRIPSLFSLGFSRFFVFLVSFFHGFLQNLGLFCSLVHLYLLSKYFASTCALFFSSILTVKFFLYILEFILR